MKGQIKRVLTILFAVLFVTTMAASAVSAGSVATAAPSTATLTASAAYYDDGDGCGNDYLWWWWHHIHPPVPPQPDPWYSIDQVTKINSGFITNPGVITSSGTQFNSVNQM